MISQKKFGPPSYFSYFYGPILEQMERNLLGARQGEVEIPSYVDDINGVICDWEGSLDMKRVGQRSADIMENVAANWNLPLESTKREILVL